MKAPGKLCVTYTHQCAACSNIQDVGHDIPAGAEIPLPVLPEGWHLVDGLLPMIFCPNHDLTLIIKRVGMEDKEIKL